MKLLLQLFANACIVYSSTNISTIRLAKEIVVNELPWTVNIFRFNYDNLKFEHYCTGVIVDKIWVLTSAHCLENGMKMEELMVVSGVYKPDQNLKEQVRYIMKKTTHPLFAKSPMEHDLVMIKLTTDLLFDGNTEAVNLPDENFEVSGRMVVSGWGLSTWKDNEGFLLNRTRRTMFRTLDRKNCLTKYEINGVEDDIVCADKISDKSVCVGGGAGGICQREFTTVLCGIFSHKTKDCIKTETFKSHAHSIFINVPDNVEWITQVIQNKPTNRISDKNLDKLNAVTQIIMLVILALMVVIIFSNKKLIYFRLPTKTGFQKIKQNDGITTIHT